MARRSFNWISEMAAEMRKAGVLSASRRTCSKAGQPDEYNLVLGDKPVEQTQYNTPELTQEQLKEHTLRQQFYDLFNRQPTAEEVLFYKDMPSLLS